MQLEIGKIYDGKVNGITKFGAFVDFDSETKGMVHISEVSNSFVEDIKDFLKEGQIVKVKVISISESGKVALSVKKAEPPKPQNNNSNSNRSAQQNRGNGGGNIGGSGGGSGGNRKGGGGRSEKNTAPQTPETEFESMMNKFKQSSDERMHDLKKTIDNKRKGGGGPRRK